MCPRQSGKRLNIQLPSFSFFPSSMCTLMFGENATYLPPSPPFSPPFPTYPHTTDLKKPARKGGPFTVSTPPFFFFPSPLPLYPGTANRARTRSSAFFFEIVGPFFPSFFFLFFFFFLRKGWHMREEVKLFCRGWTAALLPFTSIYLSLFPLPPLPATHGKVGRPVPLDLPSSLVLSSPLPLRAGETRYKFRSSCFSLFVSKQPLVEREKFSEALCESPSLT